MSGARLGPPECCPFVNSGSLAKSSGKDARKARNADGAPGGWPLGSRSHLCGPLSKTVICSGRCAP
eukprot:11191490-Lingulodinium_polyedra.AAC.1